MAGRMITKTWRFVAVNPKNDDPEDIASKITCTIQAILVKSKGLFSTFMLLDCAVSFPPLASRFDSWCFPAMQKY